MQMHEGTAADIYTYIYTHIKELKACDPPLLAKVFKHTNTQWLLQSM